MPTVPSRRISSKNSAWLKLRLAASWTRTSKGSVRPQSRSFSTPIRSFRSSQGLLGFQKGRTTVNNTRRSWRPWLLEETWTPSFPIIAQRTNDWMLIKEVEGLFSGGVSFQQLADGLQPPGAVRESDLAGPFDGLASSRIQIWRSYPTNPFLFRMAGFQKSAHRWLVFEHR